MHIFYLVFFVCNLAIASQGTSDIEEEEGFSEKVTEVHSGNTGKCTAEDEECTAEEDDEVVKHNYMKYSRRENVNARADDIAEETRKEEAEITKEQTDNDMKNAAEEMPDEADIEEATKINPGESPDKATEAGPEGTSKYARKKRPARPPTHFDGLASVMMSMMGNPQMMGMMMQGMVQGMLPQNSRSKRDREEDQNLKHNYMKNKQESSIEENDDVVENTRNEEADITKGLEENEVKNTAEEIPEADPEEATKINPDESSTAATEGDIADADNEAMDRDSVETSNKATDSDPEEAAKKFDEKIHTSPPPMDFDGLANVMMSLMGDPQIMETLVQDMVKQAQDASDN